MINGCHPGTIRNKMTIFIIIFPFFLYFFAPSVFGGSLPDHSPKWIIKYGGHWVEYGLSDLDNFVSPGFLYCQIGTWLDGDQDEPFANITLEFNDLTVEPWNEDNRDLFVLIKERDGISANLPPIYTSADPQVRRGLDTDTVWSNGSISFEPPYSFKRYDLFRYYHFNNYLKDEISGNQITEASDIRKCIILIHGWNRESDHNAYDNDTDPDNRRFYELRNNLISELEYSEWKLITYHWERDADTGGIFAPEQQVAAQNGTAAAEAAHLHGQHLGQLLDCIAPNIEKIHIIAHSAGSWAARSTAKHILSNNTSAEVQITLLDPFMPNQAGISSSVLGKTIMDQLDSIPGNSRLYKLENYYSDDVATLGTQEYFNWRQGKDKNRCIGGSAITGTTEFGDHSGPISFYAATVDNPVGIIIPDDWRFGNIQPDPSFGQGWAESMFYNEVLSLNIDSNPSGATITVSLTDENGNKNGTTPFNREYARGSNITLTAPSTLGNRSFQKWLIDGESYSSQSCSFTMKRSRHAVAVYTESTQIAIKAPENLQAEALAHDKIRLTWTDNGTNLAAQFLIGRSTYLSDNLADWTWLASVNISNKEYTSTGLLENTRYYYRLHPQTDQGFYSDIYAITYAVTQHVVLLDQTISGYIRNSGGVGISGVEILGSGGIYSTSNSSGYYSLNVPYGWSGAITPQIVNYTFSPSSRSFSSVTTEKTNQNYTGTRIYIISGYVRNPQGDGISGVKISIDGGGSAITQFSGYYALSVNEGWSGRVNISFKPGYDINPTYYDYTSVSSSQESQNYIGYFMYDGGSGKDFDPFQIATLECFQRFANRPKEWDQHFILLNDIDLTGQTYSTAIIAADTIPANDTFDGIGFSGVFNGSGHKVLNMAIDSLTGSENLGLFGKINNEGTVVNLSLENVNIICRGDRSGALCGINEGKIYNCSSSGTIINDTLYADGDADYTGGLCGYNSSTTSHIENSVSSCSIRLIGKGSYYGTGGICGSNQGIITTCYYTGSIVSDGTAVGGVCGLNFGGNISRSYSIGNINGDDHVGGLCGFNDSGIISTSYSAGAIHGNSKVGGLCGWNLNATIDNCHSTGRVSADNNSSAIGGLCGSNFSGLIFFSFGPAKDSTILNSYSTGDVIVGNGCSSVGGLCGNSDSGGVNLSSGAKCEITNCYSSGKISIGEGCSFVGGFCGSSICNTSSGPCLINNCFSNGTIIGGANNQELGGLCGRLYSANVSSSHSKGDITLNNGSSYIGGLCGRNAGGTVIMNSYSIGNVSCDYNSRYIGGLCGENEAVINRCYSEGDVNAGDTTSYYAGGLCGYNLRGSISNCYSHSNVKGGRRGGGFCGKNDGGSIYNSYSTGNLRFSSDLGYFCSVNDNGGSINNCFWDVEIADWYTNPGENNYGAIGKTTIEMQALYTFTNAGWDFVSESDNGTDDFWRQPYQSGCPILYWQRDIPGDFTDCYGVNIFDLAIFVQEWLDFQLSMDKSGDGVVNFEDWAVFANNWDGNMSQLYDFISQWLKTGKNDLLADIAPQPNGDGTVNVLDFAVFAEYWLEGVEQ